MSVFHSYSPESPTPDDDVFKHLAETYSFNHLTMHMGMPCRDGTPGFKNGTTNGAAWYPLTGEITKLTSLIRISEANRTFFIDRWNARLQLR